MGGIIVLVTLAFAVGLLMEVTRRRYARTDGRIGRSGLLPIFSPSVAGSCPGRSSMLMLFFLGYVPNLG